MTRLSSIQSMRDSSPMAALETAIEAIREWNDRWGEHNRIHEPEEHAKTLRILGGLLEMQANEVAASVREGEAKFIRETLEAQGRAA